MVVKVVGNGLLLRTALGYNVDTSRHAPGRSCWASGVENFEEQGFAPVSDVYSSPLLRCAQTSASAIQGLEIDGLEMKIENALAEICAKIGINLGR